MNKHGCPNCGGRVVRNGDNYLCVPCGCEWRPAPIPSVSTYPPSDALFDAIARQTRERYGIKGW